MEMRNIRLTIEYDGTRYYGWKSPKRDRMSTISGRIGETLRRMTGEEVVLFCGEKTEPGVHAIRQTVSFRTASRIQEEQIRLYLNQYLPLDIAVRDVAESPERFHAELTPHISTYRYRILAAKHTMKAENVFQRKYVDFRTEMPNIQRMENAAEQFKGQHDFSMFSVGKTKKSTVRELMELRMLSEDPEIQRFNKSTFFQTGDDSTNYQEIHILMKADGFLKQMPQKIIGTLLDVGYGRRKESCIDHIWEGRETASADCVNHALFLEEVTY